jgi:hypothetical protein
VIRCRQWFSSTESGSSSMQLLDNTCTVHLDFLGSRPLNVSLSYLSFLFPEFTEFGACSCRTLEQKGVLGGTPADLEVFTSVSRISETLYKVKLVGRCIRVLAIDSCILVEVRIWKTHLSALLIHCYLFLTYAHAAGGYLRHILWPWQHQNALLVARVSLFRHCSGFYIPIKDLYSPQSDSREHSSEPKSALGL